MKPKHQRLIFITLILALSGTALWLFLSKIEDNIVYFYAPSEIISKKIQSNHLIRVGGLVVSGSIARRDGELSFSISDEANELKVKYSGIVPNLFREGQGVVAEGKLYENIFYASTILAKHDENYMPPEVAKSLKQQKNWRGEK